MAGVSDTPGFVADLGPPNGRRIRYTWLCSRSWTPKMAGVSDTPGFVADLGPPKMAGVSDTPGFVADLGPPKWQVYQIHLAL